MPTDLLVDSWLKVSQPFQRSLLTSTVQLQDLVAIIELESVGALQQFNMEGTATFRPERSGSAANRVADHALQLDG